MQACLSVHSKKVSICQLTILSALSGLLPVAKRCELCEKCRRFEEARTYKAFAEARDSSSQIDVLAPVDRVQSSLDSVLSMYTVLYLPCSLIMLGLQCASTQT
jgi:hypothetical protein